MSSAATKKRFIRSCANSSLSNGNGHGERVCAELRTRRAASASTHTSLNVAAALLSFKSAAITGPRTRPRPAQRAPHTPPPCTEGFSVLQAALGLSLQGRGRAGSPAARGSVFFCACARLAQQRQQRDRTANSAHSGLVRSCALSVAALQCAPPLPSPLVQHCARHDSAIAAAAVARAKGADRMAGLATGRLQAEADSGVLSGRLAAVRCCGSGSQSMCAPLCCTRPLLVEAEGLERPRQRSYALRRCGGPQIKPRCISKHGHSRSSSGCQTRSRRHSASTAQPRGARSKRRGLGEQKAEGLRGAPLCLDCAHSRHRHRPSLTRHPDRKQRQNGTGLSKASPPALTDHPQGRTLNRSLFSLTEPSPSTRTAVRQQHAQQQQQQQLQQQQQQHDHPSSARPGLSSTCQVRINAAENMAIAML